MLATAAVLGIAFALTGCQYTKDITVPANATASCSVITGPGASTPR